MTREFLSMFTQLCADQVAQLTREEVRSMDSGELMQAIWLGESAYGSRSVAPEHDHRRCLERNELERVLYLVQQVLRCRKPR